MGKLLKNHSDTKPQYAPFDWIMSLPVIRLLSPIYEWNRGFWIYCFLGFMSVVSDFAVAALVKPFISLATLITVVSFSVSTVLSFVMFRYLYFDRTNNSFFHEFAKFVPSRLFTFLLGELIMLVFVDILKYNFWLIKVIEIPITAGLNYLTSKFFVFKDKKEK